VVHFLRSKAFRRGGWILVGLGLLGCWAYWASQGQRGTAQEQALLDPLPQDPNLQVYFNHSQAAAYTDPYRQQSRLGDNLEQVLVDAITTAQSSVDLAVQELNLPQVALALKQRHKQGIQVRVIVENSYRQPLSQLSRQAVQRLDARSRKKYEDFFQFADQNRNGQLEAPEIAASDAMAILQTAALPLKDDTADGSKGSDLMHQKFLVIDGQRVLTGSANFTWSDIHGDWSSAASQGNANHLLKIESPELARLYRQEFELMWGGRSQPKFGLQKPARAPQTVALGAGSSASQVTVQFSPTSTRLPWNQSVNGLIGRTLTQARQSIDLALFVFSDQQISNVLEQEHRQGVQIRALIEPSFAYRDYSEGLDLLGLRLPNLQCRYEADNRPWSTPLQTMGIPQLPEGDLLHHKFGLIDQQIVITGSQNWSEAANRSNDENLLVIRNPTVAAHFQREFDRLYGSALLGMTPKLQDKMQRQQGSCGGR
jgi:phosphatidylserine/phosphatidylglycerophosphate/cardiolipin synthase-like enzyme